MIADVITNASAKSNTTEATITITANPISFDKLLSSLTLTLANIFMAKWQKNIVEEQSKTGEFYGR